MIAERLPVVPGELQQLDRATPQELAFLATVRKHLATARVSKTTGNITFEAVMKDGGISCRWVTVKVQEK